MILGYFFFSTTFMYVFIYFGNQYSKPNALHLYLEFIIDILTMLKYKYIILTQMTSKCHVLYSDSNVHLV